MRSTLPSPTPANSTTNSVDAAGEVDRNYNTCGQDEEEEEKKHAITHLASNSSNCATDQTTDHVNTSAIAAAVVQCREGLCTPVSLLTRYNNAFAKMQTVTPSPIMSGFNAELLSGSLLDAQAINDSSSHDTLAKMCSLHSNDSPLSFVRSVTYPVDAAHDLVNSCHQQVDLQPYSFPVMTKSEAQTQLCTHAASSITLPMLPAVTATKMLVMSSSTSTTPDDNSEHSGSVSRTINQGNGNKQL
uniref:Zinc finger and BTB domain-containing protein 22 n=1 Tax=Lygus hesperus TaxID=30085 RepID=A0A0A9Y9M4_LYGHE